MAEVKTEDRIKVFEKEFVELLAKNELEYIIMVDFPIYKILPPEVELAMKIINKHGVQYQLGYSDIIKK